MPIISPISETAAIYDATGSAVTTVVLTGSGPYFGTWAANADVGDYAIKSNGAFEWVRLERESVQVLASFAFDAPNSRITAIAWLEGVQSDANLDSATLELFTLDGTSLVSATEESLSDEGVFNFAFAVPTFALGENLCYAVVSIAQEQDPPVTLTTTVPVVFIKDA